MRRWLLLVDLDGTLWDHKDISTLDPPFRRISDDVIADSNNITVKLNREMIKVVKWARENGAIVSTLSWNIPEKALSALKAFDVVKYFDYITVENTRRKDIMIVKLLKKIESEKGLKINLNDIIYIDDLTIHIDDIYRNIGKIHFLQIGVDFKTFEEAKAIIRKILQL